MKISILLTFLLFNFQSPTTHLETYVCLPCGHTCDKEIHSGPGTCSSCGMELVKKSSIKFTNLTLDELCDRLAKNPKAILLDVRSPREFNGSAFGMSTYGHFKKAININVDEVEARIGELLKYKDQEVIVYCSHSQRSPRVSYLLGTHGFLNVENMSGGVSTISSQSNPDCLKKEFVFH